MFTTVLIFFLLHSIDAFQFRVKRFDQYESSKSYGPYGGDVHHGAALAQAKIDNYPTAPAEAFFGKGVHTHSLPIQSGHGAGELTHTLDIPDILDLKNVVQPGHNENWSNKHHVGGVDGGKAHNVTWDPLIEKYHKNIDDTNAAIGQTQTHPIHKTPTGFFGRSGHHHDTGIEGGESEKPISGKHTINDIVIDHSFHNTHSQHQHGHQVAGIKTYDTVNDTKHFGSFVPHHANHAGQQSVMTNSAIHHSSNPNMKPLGHDQPVPGEDVWKPHMTQHEPAPAVPTLSVSGNPFMNSSSHNPFLTSGQRTRLVPAPTADTTHH